MLLFCRFPSMSWSCFASSPSHCFFNWNNWTIRYSFTTLLIDSLCAFVRLIWLKLSCGCCAFPRHYYSQRLISDWFLSICFLTYGWRTFVPLFRSTYPYNLSVLQCWVVQSAFCSSCRHYFSLNFVLNSLSSAYDRCWWKGFLHIFTIGLYVGENNDLHGNCDSFGLGNVVSAFLRHTCLHFRMLLLRRLSSGNLFCWLC